MRDEPDPRGTPRSGALSARQETLAGWGGHPRVVARPVRGEHLERITADAVLTRGLGRSYGDASLPPAGALVAESTRADRVLAFDSERGILRAEAGMTLRDLNRTFMPRGWTVPVSPGTEFVTLGGMVAADVHGKNHHIAGCIGEHVQSLQIALASGDTVRATYESHSDLMRATVGGMGLTGHILEVEMRLAPIPSCWIVSEAHATADLEATCDSLRQASATHPFTVCWIDASARGRRLGRGIVLRGDWAAADDAPSPSVRARGSSPRTPWSLPMALPRVSTSTAVFSLFNHAYYAWNRLRQGRRVSAPGPFFYPLDGIGRWNRAYGKAGFTQYQCVVPRARDEGIGALKRILETVHQHGAASAISVLKDCGPEGRGVLSFPLAGVSLALDLPMRGTATSALVAALNEIVIDAGGRVYLAKDALTTREQFERMEPRLVEFRRLRRRFDPDHRLRSLLSTRLLDESAAKDNLVEPAGGLP